MSNVAQQETSPLVSIIVPIYNVERYLAECLDSIIAQTFADFEAILVNDGSTDASLAIAQHYVRNEPRFRLISQKNGGLSAARNAAIGLTRGRYLLFVDSDDLLDPEMLEALVGRIQEAGADMAMCTYARLSDDEVAPIRFPKAYEGRVLSQLELWHLGYELAPSVFVVAWNKLYRREMFDTVRYREGIYFEDFEVICRLVAPWSAFALVNRPLYYHRERGDSITQTAGKVWYLSSCEALVARDAYFRERGWDELIAQNAKQLMSFLCVAYQGLDEADEPTRRRYAELRARACEIAREVLERGGLGWELTVRARLFLVGERAYLAGVAVRNGLVAVKSKLR